jgi:hypothetical protein
MTTTPTGMQVVVDVRTPAPKAAANGTNGRKPWSLGSLFGGCGAEIKAAVTAVRKGEEGADSKFVALYMDPSMDLKDKARALSQLAKEFEDCTNAMRIDADGAAGGANLADVLELLAQSCALEARSRDLDAAMQRIRDQITLILEDETECNVYHDYPDLRLSCAMAKFALQKDEPESAREKTLSECVRDDSAPCGPDSVPDTRLQDWALETALAEGYDGVVKRCCSIPRMVPVIMAQAKGRAAMESALSETENGVRGALFGSISNARGPGVMQLLARVIENPKMAVGALECAASCEAITPDDEAKLVSRLWDKGNHNALETALHGDRTSAMVSRCLLGPESMDATIPFLAEAISSAKPKERGLMLGSIAVVGGTGVTPLLAGLVENPELAIEVLACAGACKAVTVADEITIMSKLMEKGDQVLRPQSEPEAAAKTDAKGTEAKAETAAEAKAEGATPGPKKDADKTGFELVETALHNPATRALAIRALLPSEKGREMIMQAVEDSGDEAAMLGTLAAQGEPKIQFILQSWSQSPATRGYFFRTASMLRATSTELQDVVLTYAGATGKEAVERKAARKAFAQMMEHEAQRKIAALDAALTEACRAMSEDLQHEPGQMVMGWNATGQAYGMRVDVNADFVYEKTGEGTPDPEATAGMKTAAFSAVAQKLLSSLSESLLGKAGLRVLGVKQVQIEDTEGYFSLRTKFDVEFTPGL